jgi:hypothetical protein
MHKLSAYLLMTFAVIAFAAIVMIPTGSVWG